VHLSIVAYERQLLPPLVQIDTQQLLSAGSREAVARASPAQVSPFEDMTGQGHRAFAEALARFAAGAADGRVTAIAERAAAPLRVVVRGRRGWAAGRWRLPWAAPGSRRESW